MPKLNPGDEIADPRDISRRARMVKVVERPRAKRPAFLGHCGVLYGYEDVRAHIRYARKNRERVNRLAKQMLAKDDLAEHVRLYHQMELDNGDTDQWGALLEQLVCDGSIAHWARKKE